MVKSVELCHMHNIIHRDIKMENFLVQQINDNGEIQIKLSDFGLACKFDPANPPTSKCGSLSSVAPEILCQENHDTKVDCWSLGVLLFELLSTELPFYSEDQKVHLRNIVS